MPDYFDLGSYTRPVTTGSDLAQTWFNRGLLWAYGFNHEEAAACFERAPTAGPDCVMGYGRRPDAAGAEAKGVPERALGSLGGEAHPGVQHMYILLMEMSARPEDALRAGGLLRDLVPDAGPLRHMPTRLDVLCGDYRSVVS